ncbi:MAG: hypothetical protein IPM51_08610 [Sphingobacteriaceae bacterium]|nr:hypothetical protein [Sphingobacteriaceae bacterium]
MTTYTKLVKELNNDEDPLMKVISSQLKQLFELPIHNIPVDTENLRPQDLEMISKIFPGLNTSFSLSDMFNHMQKFNEQLSDQKNFKDLRRYSLENLPAFSSLKDTSLQTINDTLKASPCGKTLDEMINEHNNGKPVSLNQKFISGFMILNLFGLDQEKNKKANYISLSNDAQHAFYATYSDFLITEDEGLRTKAKVMYENFALKTIVFSAEEFFAYTGNMVTHTQLSIMDFINRVKIDIAPDRLIETTQSTKFNRLTSLYSPVTSYFDYFDLIEFIDDVDTGKGIILRPNKYMQLSYLFYEEIKLITNKIHASFGNDSENKDQFDMELESKAINKGVWEGRIWVLPGAYINLEINKGTQQLSLCIIFVPEKTNGI